MPPSILVVDDDDAILQMLEDFLQSHGYDAVLCTTAAQAQELLLKRPFAAILLDVLLPKLNGFRLLESLREVGHTQDTPVIVMSGIYRSRNHKEDLQRRLGIVDYLDKPLDAPSLLHALQTACGAADQEPVLLDKPKTVLLTRRKDTPPPMDPRLVDAAAEQEREQVETDAKIQFHQRALSLRGSIDHASIAFLMADLWLRKATGALLLRRENVKKIVYLDDGNAASTKSNRVSECLGQLLVRERLINGKQCQRSIEIMRQTGRKQGEILVEMGCITPRNLEFALELQKEIKLMDVFEWQEGEYRFNSSVVPQTDNAPLEWQGAALVSEGIRRAYDETRLRQVLIPLLDTPLALQTPATPWDQLGLSEDEVVAALSIQSGKTLRELLDLLPLDPADSMRLVFILLAFKNIVVD